MLLYFSLILLYFYPILNPLFSGVFFVTPYTAYANQTEEEFKNICGIIAKEFSETVSPAGEEYAVSDEEIEETFVRQRKLFKEWQKELKNLIRLSPDSIWADDAQYIIATLNAGNYSQQVVELEYLLRNYPNSHIEDWTKENLFFIPVAPIDLVVRLELCLAYKELGEVEKLKQLCEESKRKFPEKALVFDKLLTDITSPAPK